MKSALILFFSLIICTYLHANQSVLSIGEIADYDIDLVLNEKTMSPRKDGGVVMLVKSTFPGRVLLLDNQGKIEKSLSLGSQHVDTAEVFQETLEIIQLSSGNYVLASQNLDSNKHPYYRQTILSPDLEIVSSSVYALSSGYRKVQNIYNTNDDTYVALFSTVSGIRKLKIVKFNINGQEIWSNEQILPINIVAIQRSRFLALSDDNGFSYHTFIPSFVCTNFNSLLSYWFFSQVFDKNGVRKHQFSQELKGYPYVFRDYPSIHGCIADGQNYKYSFSFYTHTSPFVKIYNLSLPDTIQNTELITLEHVYGGNVRSIINDNGDVFSVGIKHLYIRSIDENHLIEIIPLKGNDIAQIGYLSFCRRPEGGWWVTGLIEYNDGSVKDLLIGLPQQQYLVEGNVFKDRDSNDVYEETDPPYHTPWVNFNSIFSYYSKVDPNGEYSLRLGADTYQIDVKSNSDIWKLSENKQQVEITNNTKLNLPVQAKVICPEMTVNVIAPVLMRCRNNTYEVNYYNSGSDVADDAYIEISLDPYLTVSNSTYPYTVTNNGKLRFDLSDIYPEEHGQFFFDAYLDCENTVSGQTHCVTAKIYPYENCRMPDSCWDGSIIEIEGDCVNDTAHFRIINRGDFSINPRSMFVLEDDIMINNSSFLSFNRGEIKRFAFRSNGKTIRVEVPQSECYPYKSYPSLTIEGCGGLQQPGLVRTLPQDDAARFVSISCNESWDEIPKYFLRADPKGYGEKYYITDSTDIQYTFNFPTDFENSLYLIDTLSDNLDLHSFTINSSSHPYKYTLFNNGILKVDFELADTVTLGYFQFTIKPKKDTPVQAEVINRGRFFENLPSGYPTNTVFHTIGKEFIKIDLKTSVPEWKDKIAVKVYPNPFGNMVRIDFLQENHNTFIEVFDIQGKVLKRASLNRSNIISTEEFPVGIYLFRILSNDEIISTGKLIKQ